MRSHRIYIFSSFLSAFFFALLFTIAAHAADAPAWLQHVAAKEITKKGFLESQTVLDPLSISTIRIQISTDDYTSLINDTGSNIYRLATMTYESPKIPLQTIEQVGIRLRGAAARGSRKKSFKISFEEFGHDDREFYNLSKLNLNSDFQDPHLMRAKTCTDLFRKMGVPAARVGYAKLYINDEFRGLFANSEDLDKAFLNANFKNNDGNLYKCPGGASMQNGAGGYELQTNKDASDFSDILDFISVLNNTPEATFKNEIEKVLNVDEILMYVACNVLLGAWDDYWVLVKNYYFYHDLSNDLFNYIPHDFDGSLGTDWYHGNIAHGNVYNWSPNSGRPMVENLLAVPEYRDRYTHYLMMLCMHPFSLEAMEPELDRTADMIRETLINDPFWGWHTSDFDDAFEHSIPRGNVKYGMKEYIELRRNSALEQLEPVGPFIKELKREPLLVKSTDAVTFSHLVVDQYSVNSVTLVYKVGSAVSEIPMLDNGAGVDESANDFVYSAQIPAISDSGTVQYYVTSTNNNGRTSRYPAENEWESYALNYQPPNLLINELLAQNDAYFKDNYDEYNDWFEIYNPTNELLDLTGMYVSDDLTEPRKWRLGNLSIPANGFLLLWADDDAEQGSNHVGFKLSGSGEQLGLFDRDENENLPIDTLSFGPQLLDISYGRTQDGADEWIFYNKPTPGIGNRDSTTIIGGGGGGGDTPTGDDITDLGGSIRGSNDHLPWTGVDSDGSPDAERIEMLIDNDVNTKYLVGDELSWLEYSIDENALVTGYSITSANDTPDRDPRSWRLQGWDASTNSWVTLHSVSNQPIWEERFQTKTWGFSNTDKWFSKFRLLILAINGNNDGLMQMAELEIFGNLESQVNVEDDDAIVNDYRLEQNYPNPFNPSTRIQFSIPKATHVRLSIYNTLGQRVKTLIDQPINAGVQNFIWNGANEDGVSASNGIYYYRLNSEFGAKTKKMLFLR
jgi:hypothetical protein